MNLKKLILTGMMALSINFISCYKDIENSNASEYNASKCNSCMDSCMNWYKFDSSKISSDVKTPKEIDSFVKDNRQIKYADDGEYFPQLGGDFWQLPCETLDVKRGDCEDKALLGLAIYYQKTGKKGSLLIGAINNSGHAVANYGGEWYCKNFKIIKEISWDDIPQELFESRYVKTRILKN